MLQGTTARLAIRDDGRGLPAPPGSEAGLGLRIMQYRADRIRGALEVGNDPQGGTRVVCRFAIGEPQNV